MRCVRLMSELYSRNVGVEFVERAGIDVNQLIDKLRKAAAAELFQS